MLSWDFIHLTKINYLFLHIFIMHKLTATNSYNNTELKMFLFSICPNAHIVLICKQLKNIYRIYCLV